MLQKRFKLFLVANTVTQPSKQIVETHIRSVHITALVVLFTNNLSVLTACHPVMLTGLIYNQCLNFFHCWPRLMLSVWI